VIIVTAKEHASRKPRNKTHGVAPLFFENMDNHTIQMQHMSFVSGDAYHPGEIFNTA
jgi:hypothetical protein